MILPSTERSRLAAARFRIDGIWSVEEFQSLLLNLNDVYQRLATVMLLGDLLHDEENLNAELGSAEHRQQQDWFWLRLYDGSVYMFDEQLRYRRQPLAAVLEVTQLLVAPLGVDAIRLESPGWVQVIGHLNPLKVMADFVSKWRAENTRRLNIRTTAATERERIRTEAELRREQMLRDFAVAVLNHMPESRRGPAAERLAEIASYAITPSTSALQRIADDSRLLDSEVVPPGAPLPSRRRR